MADINNVDIVTVNLTTSQRNCDGVLVFSFQNSEINSKKVQQFKQRIETYYMLEAPDEN